MNDGGPDWREEDKRLKARIAELEGAVWALRRTLFRVGVKLRDYELSEERVSLFGAELVDRSGVCERCQGEGQDGDPPDANGEGGAIFACEKCGGSGMLPAVKPEGEPSCDYDP